MSILRTLLFTAAVLFATQLQATDLGFPTLNSVGRYWGWGWSRNTYHSCVDGRFNVITNRHPASAYASSSLTSIYSPEYRNYPPRPVMSSPAPTFWNAPTIVDRPEGLKDSKSSAARERSVLEEHSKQSSKDAESKKSAEAATAQELPPQVKPAKPVEPPPSWLKPYLENEKKGQGEVIELESSPSDRPNSSQSPVNRYRR